jgi:hypothetical protein
MFTNAIQLPPMTAYQGQQETFDMDFSESDIVLQGPIKLNFATDPDGVNKVVENIPSVNGLILTLVLPALEPGEYFFDARSSTNGVLITGTLSVKSTITKPW